MRIGIVTHPLYFNYGGILQNYALQQVLKDMGHDPVTLDYMPSLSFKKYLISTVKRLLSAPLFYKLRTLQPYTHFVERSPRIDCFVRNNIVLSKKVSKYTRQLLEDNQIDALIVGSDQVWRYSYSYHYLEDMFLEFAKNYSCLKIAYAASFGIEHWDYPAARAMRVKELAKEFNAVSVREDSGVIQCRENLGIDAVITLDPTLLLNASDYERLLVAPKPNKAHYLAAYVLDMTKEKSSYIDLVAKINGLKVHRMTASETGTSMEQWLSAIKNADFVMTDSYHGSLFSIIFQKQFVTFINEGRGADRFTTLFRRLGLMNRLIDAPYSSPAVEESIDYSSVYSRLHHLRQESLSYLKSSLS